MRGRSAQLAVFVGTPGVAWLLRKDGTMPEQLLDDLSRLDEDQPFSGIRCPLCGWRPTPASRWLCLWIESPEPFFQACGTEWNTFATHGRCPGCTHQWQWTSCLRCGEWSPHDDWYEAESSE